MSEKRSLAFQRQSVEHLIALYGREDDTILDGAKQAALTLGWLERQGELLKMWDHLRRQRPDLYETMQGILLAFPGATLEDVRDADNGF